MRRLTDEDLKKIDAINHGFKNRPEALEVVSKALNGSLYRFGLGAGKIIKLDKDEEISVSYSKGKITDLYEKVLNEDIVWYKLNSRGNFYTPNTWAELALQGYTLGEAQQIMKEVVSND